MNPRELVENLSAEGAVLTLVEHGVNVLVGRLDWVDQHRIFYFEAGSENEFGCHLLRFDDVVAPHHLGVAFRHKDGTLIAYLTTIREAVDDVAAYEAAWAAWKQRRELMNPFTDQAKAQFLGE